MGAESLSEFLPQRRYTRYAVHLIEDRSASGHFGQEFCIQRTGTRHIDHLYAFGLRGLQVPIGISVHRA